MNKHHKLKILNDPIYGFITIPSQQVYDIIEHPYFQRLRRIAQMGMSYLVYPGAIHTRFHHALGCLHLMQQAIQVLISKGVSISDKEEDALHKAILLHDIGHGPFSHALENKLIAGVHHEEISLAFMHRLNDEFNGNLTMAIEIFEGKYHRPFMLQLVSSQLDVDRLDYLKRDSFYTGVAEGNINSQRIISMLNVVDDQLVVEQKGQYSIEHFLTARRLMYWQVYLHKTGLGAEHLLQSVIKRTKELIHKGEEVSLSPRLKHFIASKQEKLTSDNLHQFAFLDDSDIIMMLKANMTHVDIVLSELCTMIINRQLLKIKWTDEPVTEDMLAKKINKLNKRYNFNTAQSSYFIFSGAVSQQPYSNKEPIQFINKKNEIVKTKEINKIINLEQLSKPEEKFYYCYPKIQD